MNSYPTDDNANRVRSVVDNLIGTEDADDIMIELMDSLTAHPHHLQVLENIMCSYTMPKLLTYNMIPIH